MSAGSECVVLVVSWIPKCCEQTVQIPWWERCGLLLVHWPLPDHHKPSLFIHTHFYPFFLSFHHNSLFIPFINPSTSYLDYLFLLTPPFQNKCVHRKSFHSYVSLSLPYTLSCFCVKWTDQRVKKRTWRENGCMFRKGWENRKDERIKEERSNTFLSAWNPGHVIKFHSQFLLNEFTTFFWNVSRRGVSSSVCRLEIK